MGLVLPMFFALSGFLVAGSLERSKTLIMFLGLRILRIVPALSVEVLLSAFIPGPLLTTYPLTAYFSDTRFFAYFLNILGDIHYTLPGLFLSNPRPETVNLQLWTVPFELGCYIVLVFISLVGVFKRRSWFLLAVIGYYGMQIVNTALRPSGPVGGTPNGKILIAAFVMGVFV
jgi:peptidoglycan/LPS O-acetylase OafA/YrhL